ncbi:MAG TPA: HD-GYP domain-containing protein, partial [Petrotogaceae bacterium]|nr:HD-GYP domain-containing protein [Petrotogaceae bacterium]
ASRGHSIEKLQSVGYTASDLLETEDVMIVDPQSAYKFFDEEKARKSLEAIEPCKKRMIITIYADNKAVGNFILDIAKDSTKDFSQDSVKAMKVFSVTASAFLTYNRYTDLKGRMQKDIIMTMINILEVHDVYTKGHSNNVADIAVKIARAMDMNRQDVLMVYWAGLVHDIGKILIPQAILNKPSNLTDAEYEEIKKHPEYGYIFLKKQEELKQIAEIVRYHHERFDGKGYPKGLKGEEIPLFSRIISVADAYDAIISLRPYRAPLSAEQAREEIFKNSGTQFDPKIVSVFFGLKL